MDVAIQSTSRRGSPLHLVVQSTSVCVFVEGDGRATIRDLPGAGCIRGTCKTSGIHIAVVTSGRRI